jgi:hypothetical protein
MYVSIIETNTGAKNCHFHQNLTYFTIIILLQSVKMYNKHSMLAKGLVCSHGLLILILLILKTWLFGCMF